MKNDIKIRMILIMINNNDNGNSLTTTNIKNMKDILSIFQERNWQRSPIAVI